MAFLLGPWTLLIHFTNNKEANTGLEQRNKSKITYTPWAASMLDCVLQELENRVFPWVFMHREPIRSHHLRSRDPHVGFQSSDARASKMAGHTSSSAAYLGALGFTKPLERIVLHAVPLKSLLKWLLKPRGPNLVEATMGSAPEKALVLAATKHMLYEEDPPSVGVGLMYKPHYISTESFCIAYMHLNVWHAAASSEDSTDKLDSTRLILVSISEMSEVVPVTMLPPIFLDVGGKEVMEKTGEPLAPLWFRGFRLHTVWSRLPGGACLSDHLSSPPRGCHRTHAGVQAGEVSSGHVARA